MSCRDREGTMDRAARTVHGAVAYPRPCCVYATVAYRYCIHGPHTPSLTLCPLASVCLCVALTVLVVIKIVCVL